MIELIELSIEDMRGAKPPFEPPPNCWVAGGAVRRWFTGDEKLSDVDIFGPADDIKDFVDTCGFAKTFESKNAITFKKDGAAIQAILLPFKNVEACLDSFDFTLCQFAWDGTRIYTTPKAIIGTLRRHLAVHILGEFAVDSLRRAFKYQEKGFKPCAGTIRDLALGLSGMSQTDIQNAVEISPKGGIRTVRYD